MAGTLSVQTIQGLATAADPTTVSIASGHVLHAPGHVISVNTIRYGTRTAVSNQAAGYVLFSGSFTKILASSKLIATCNVFGASFSSGNCGVGLKLIDSAASVTWDYGVAYQYDGAWSATQQTTIIVGHSSWDNVPAGNTTIGFGWNPINGASAERPFAYFNPNSSDDARNQQMVSSIIVYEVAQ